MKLEMGHRHAVGDAGPGQSHDVFRTYVRGEDRRAHNPPSKIAAGQEIIGRSVLTFANDPPHHAQQDGEIERDHQPVQPDQRGAGRGRSQ